MSIIENSFYRLFPETVWWKTQAFLQKLDKSERETFELETANSLVVKKMTKIKEKLLSIAIVIFTNTSKSFLCLNADK